MAKIDKIADSINKLVHDFNEEYPGKLKQDKDYMFGKELDKSY